MASYNLRQASGVNYADMHDSQSSGEEWEEETCSKVSPEEEGTCEQRKKQESVFGGPRVVDGRGHGFARWPNGPSVNEKRGGKGTEGESGT